LNFLAHFYLSGSNEKLLVGNFLGDFATSAQWQGYEKGIISGIKMHYAIDNFTDKHLLVREAQKTLHQNYGRYAPVLSDIFFDHILAKYWAKYAKISLEDYAKNCYEILDAHKEIYPPKALMTFEYMKKQNWLLHYAQINGIENVLMGMARRSTYGKNIGESIVEIEKNINIWEDCFFPFFYDLETFVAKENFNIL